MGKIKLKKIHKIILLIFCTIIIILFFKPESRNSLTKLDIVSVYGDNEAYHPKVLSFKEKWHGYKYWMTYTPYPKGDDSKENPHVVASNNLINWETPKGLINSLDDIQNDGEPKKYNSDSHLVYNSDLDRIECYWRYVNDVDNEVIIYRRCSNDGVNFSDKEEFIKSDKRTERDYVSPAIIYENGIYKMWYVDKKKVQYTEKIDNNTWLDPVAMDIKYDNSQLITWHLDVIATSKGYEMIMVAYDDVNNRSTMKLYYTYSENGKNNWNIAKKILSPKTGSTSWDNLGLYRSSLIYEDGVYIVFYSGISKNDDHGIGIVYGKNIYKLKAVNIDFSKDKETNKLIELIEKER